MKLEIRELLNDIDNLRRFALINANNEIGQQLNRVLDYTSNKINEDREKEKKFIDRISF